MNKDTYERQVECGSVCVYVCVCGGVGGGVRSAETTTGPKVIKHFLMLSLLINMKMPTIVGIFIFISSEIFMLSNVYQERICNC